MSEQKWTKEPWHVDGYGVESPVWSICTMDWEYDPEDSDQSKAVDAANAARIVACVNALAGIPDPSAYVSRVAAMEEAYHELLYAVANKYDGETRHQTALRYIRERAQSSEGPSSALTPASEGGE